MKMFQRGRGFMPPSSLPKPGRAASGMPKLSAKSMRKPSSKKKKATTPRRVGRR